MIEFEEALNTVKNISWEVGTEKVSLTESLHRVLAEDVRSDMQMPPFNKSAVDGYACRKEDLDQTLKVLETVAAGQMPMQKIGTGECSKIMTGAPIPEGADSVIMVEDTEAVDEKKIRYLKDKVKDNICYRGEDIQEDAVVLSLGTLIEPQHIAVLATVGCTEPRVYRKVRVAVISTGDELVEPDKVPKPSQIRNSNAAQLISQIKKFGGIADYVGIARDTEEDTRKMITRALEGNDVVLLSGGVSMGDYDHVPKVLKELDITLHFDSVAVQPGRPTVFGSRNRKFIFGLPGNPVSSFVQFELLVKPLLYKLTGLNFQPINWRMPMGTNYSRKKSSRLSWLPVKINEQGQVIPMEYHGSAHINALTEAHGLIAVPKGISQIKEGELTDVRQI